MSALFRLRRIAAFALNELVDGLPDRLRYAAQHVTTFEATVEHDVDWTGPWVWRCPDPNYLWHASIDDSGRFDEPDEAQEAGDRHVKDFHRGRVVICGEPFEAEGRRWDCDQARGHASEHHMCHTENPNDPEDAWFYVTEGHAA